jgi:hypothetical protein
VAADEFCARRPTVVPDELENRNVTRAGLRASSRADARLLAQREEGRCPD